MIQPTEPDIVGPTITTNNPDASPHQDIRQAEQLLYTRVLAIGLALQALFHQSNARSLSLNSRLGGLISVKHGLYQFFTYDTGTPRK